VNGLFGKDAQGMCANQLSEWISELEDTEGFHEEQVEKWASAISGKIPSDSYGTKYDKITLQTWLGQISPGFFHTQIQSERLELK